MALPTELLNRLSQFVGYGPKDAKVIFIGTEEKTEDNHESRYKKRIELQAQLEPFTDLAKLCEKLTKAGLCNPQELQIGRPQATWKPLCSVMLGLEGQTDAMGDEGAIIEYQRKKLGRIPGDSLLAELLPVPKFSSGAVGEIPSRVLGIPDDIVLYRRRVLPSRQELLAGFLLDRFQNSPPRLIVAYGRPWSNFEAIFQSVHQLLKEVGPMRYYDDDHPINLNGFFKPRFTWVKMRECTIMLTYHPTARDEYDPLKFDISVAKQIIEIYSASSQD